MPDRTPSVDSARHRIGRLIRSSLVRHSGLTLASRVAGSALSLGIHALLAAALSPSGYGVFGLVTAWTSLLAIVLGLGLPEVALRFGAEYRQGNDHGRLRGLRIRLDQGLLAITGGAAGLAALLYLGAGGGRATVDIVAVGLVCTPALLMMRIHRSLAQAAQDVVAAFPLPLIGRPLVFALGLGLVSAVPAVPFNGWTAAVVFAASHFPIGGLQRLRLRTALPSPTPPPPPVFDTRTWARVAGPLLLVSGFVTLLFSTDVLVVGWLLGETSAGIYKVASLVAGPVAFVFGAVGAVVAPRIAALHADPDADSGALQRLLRTATHLAFWPTLFAALVVGAGSGWILSWIDPAYAPAQGPMLLLLAAHVVNAAAGPVGYALNMTGHEADSSRIYGITAALNVGASLLGATLFGLTGAAAATLASMTIWNVWLHVRLRTRLGVSASLFSRPA